MTEQTSNPTANVEVDGVTWIVENNSAYMVEGDNSILWAYERIGDYFTANGFDPFIDVDDDRVEVIIGDVDRATITLRHIVFAYQHLVDLGVSAAVREIEVYYAAESSAHVDAMFEFFHENGMERCVLQPDGEWTGIIHWESRY